MTDCCHLWRIAVVGTSDEVFGKMFNAPLAFPADFEGWRHAARRALTLGLPPEDLSFSVGDAAPGLFAEPLPEPPENALQPTVPKAFPEPRPQARLPCR
ncbi:hypothetical protein OH818_09500 [Jiella pelagia]|uniref:Uncharacterized protein n=1 Tax=Jiella pelagia TaxID=2986949 RepID=A0ABY7C5I7_9HYPH|nr:hypothetical protein [Jiella pelagia]WAP70294.1 hypothetical protein OH818_09500 [Jiella pelagia]